MINRLNVSRSVTKVISKGIGYSALFFKSFAMAQKSVMVLGAGLSGLCAAKRALEKDFQVTVYEKDDQMGGLWYVNDDLNRTCVYEGLKTNQPKPILEYSDFFFEGEDQYFCPQQMQDYLVAYAKKFGVDKVVKLRHKVEEVRPGVNGKGWSVAVTDLEKDQTETKLFDFVMICNGHYSNPVMPDIKGKELFQGNQMHSVSYRKAEPFRGN